MVYEDTMHYIYRITNTENKKVYIGQTNNPNLRWSQHKSNAKYNRGNQVITRAITKYGTEKFEFEVIATCLTQEDTDIAEEIVINQFDSRNKAIGYNVDAGGNTTPRTPEILQKINEGRKKYFETHDGWNKGKPWSEEIKLKMSEAAMGKAGTNTGKIFNDEWKKKLSISNRGQKRTEETIKKLSESHLGQIAPNRKLTFDQVMELRIVYNNTKVSQKALGKRYGISQATVYDIVHYITYKEV
jgi:group I intron endonuclease